MNRLSATCAAVGLVVLAACGAPGPRPAGSVMVIPKPADVPPMPGTVGPVVATPAPAASAPAVAAVAPPPAPAPPPPMPAPPPPPAAVVKAPPEPPRVLYFEPDAYKLSPRYRPTLEAHARKLKASPNLQLVIRAYTDARGAYDYNLALSKKRAETVAKQLVAMGVPPRRLELAHHGERRATAGGRTGRATAEDRRVELIYR